MYKFGPALVAVMLTATIGGWLIFAGMARLNGDRVSWWWPSIGSVRNDLFEVTRSAATIAALFGGLFAIVYAYRKQRVEEAAGHRSDSEALSKRYQDAAEQLGHQNAAVRLAGLYSMARLADDWPEQRQRCVDVLCAYLRMPLDGESQDEVDKSELEVRGSIVRTIVEHLSVDPSNSKPANVSWQDLVFDFRGAAFRDLVLEGVRFNRFVNFTRATFRGSSALRYSTFSEGVGLQGCHIYDDLRIEGLKSGHLSLQGCTVYRHSELRLTLSSARSSFVSLDYMKVLGTCRILLTGGRPADSAPISAKGFFVTGGLVTIGSFMLKRPAEYRESPRKRMICSGWQLLGNARVRLASHLLDGGELEWKAPDHEAAGSKVEKVGE
jgi:hypothetical protein